MITGHIFFAAESGGGISALGLDVKSFLFQLITFIVVLLLLKRYVFSKLIATLDARRNTLEQSLNQAKETELALKNAESKAEEILRAAREQADETINAAGKQTQVLLAEAEKRTADKTQRLLSDAREQVSREHQKLRAELKDELADLVTEATEKVIGKKLDASTDEKLVKEALR